MTGGWIKMRVWLRRDPKVIWMADHLASDRYFMSWLTDPVQQSCKGSAYEHVTGDVTRALCVTGLLEVWGTAREQGRRDGDDLIVTPCDVTAISEICGIPSFGEAMAAVGWAIEAEGNAVIFPNFFADKPSPAERHRSTGAERQARYRARKRRVTTVTGDVTGDASPGVTRDVTGDVTVTPREEKRREEKTKKKSPPFIPPTVQEVAEHCRERRSPIDPEAFVAHYTANGWRTRSGPVRDWRACVVTWEKNEKKFARNGAAPPGELFRGAREFLEGGES